jgi:hypothetical protein
VFFLLKNLRRRRLWMLNHARMHATKASGEAICADRASRPDGAARKQSDME